MTIGEQEIHSPTGVQAVELVRSERFAPGPTPSPCPRIIPGLVSRSILPI